ncbi:MAG: ribosomal RNA small subunit methyltransferase A [Candidatus Omnitrophica bacterium]|nr:ribosomal RNA small subunit methyltransferase A [Candidatus Omnitrophota bacterium]
MLNAQGIKDLVRQHNLGISPRRLGQHFLVDPRALERIVATVGAGPEDHVLEIGAGLGALTEGLLESGARVTAVERDRRFARVLESRFGRRENFRLLKGDALLLDLADLAAGNPRSLLVVGNIPYSITSPILAFLLRQRQWVKRALLTIQKEVAQRIVAPPGGKACSSISLFVRVAFKPAIAFTIHPGAFYPQPKVTSAVLRLDPLEAPAVPAEEEEAVLKLVRSIFTHRRKTLLNALALPQVELSKEEILRRLRQAGIDPTRRPETFSLQEMVILSRAVAR